MAELRIEKRLIDYVGLNVKGVLESWLAYPKDIGLMLALLQGMGPDGAKLVNVDANGNLAVTMAGQAAAGNVVPMLGGAGGSALQAGSGVGDGQAGFFAALIAPSTFNGATWDRGRSASAANLAAQSGLGAALATVPGQWSFSANGGLGAQTSGTRVAGAAGVRHILTGYCVVISSQAAPGAGTLQVAIRDGASGAGTILETYLINIPAALYQPIIIARSGLSIVGSAATAMTIESTAAYAAVGVAVNFEGYDSV